MTEKSKIIDISKAAKPDQKSGSTKEKESKPSKLSEIIAMARDKCELWHDENDEAHATFTHNDHREHWRIDSRGFKEWLSRAAFTSKIGAVSNDVLLEACANLSGFARYEGKKHKTGRRVMCANGTYWIDLANDDWQAIRIDSSGWQVVNNPPVRFLRNRNTRPLPMPKAGGNPSDLFALINTCKDDELFILAWLIECYRPDTPYPVLELFGEQGAAKSTTQRVFRSLVDPNEVMLRARPKTVEDIYVAAGNAHLVSYENLSSLSVDMSDALCVVSTGGGYAARTLYTNDEETILTAKNPVVLNGINRVVTRPDLLDRTITLSLPLIESRIDEAQHQKKVERLLPFIFSGLLDLFSQSLAILPAVEINPKRLPRMADFTKLGEAVSQARGNPAGQFLESYIDHRREAVTNTIDATPIGRAITKFIECGLDHIGTVGDLLHRLNDFESKSGIEHGDFWPKSARKLGDELRRLSPALRQIGIDCAVDAKASRDGVRCILKKN